jgi:hypothetical protein
LTAPVELLLHYLPVDENGDRLDDDMFLISADTPLLHPD